MTGERTVDRPAERTVEALARAVLVPVMRDDDPAAAVARGLGFVAGGLTALEITFTVPDAATAIRSLVAELADQTVLVGAGTVLTEQQAAAALDAGARFLVSPVNPPFLLPLAREAGVLAVPGAATPHEVWQAVAGGALMVKLFPIARLGGPAFVRDLLAPMPDLRLVATGGVGPRDVVPLLAAGCVAVALGAAFDDPTYGPTAAVRARTLLALARPDDR
jgi:2-dehydro-3-deoxyphosphogluconate aldolase / (4S)-4-hydroxy-2-oxoglutarate aldolase